MAARRDFVPEHFAPLIAVPIALVLVVASAAVRGEAAGTPPSGATPSPTTTQRDPRSEDRFEPASEPTVSDRRPALAGSSLPSEQPAPMPAAPIQWRRWTSLHCFRHDGRRYCDGPLRAPEPHGPAAARATELGLDDARRVAHRALGQRPAPEWLDAVEGEAGGELLWPVPDGRVTRGYGDQHVLVPFGEGRGVRPGEEMRLHPGVDIAAEPGSPIRAADAGLVVYADAVIQGYGNGLILLHPDGSVTLYAHCRAILVFAGQRVRRGEVIAEVGETGLAHGPHLHFEWRRDGHALDPLAHFTDAPRRGTP